MKHPLSVEKYDGSLAELAKEISLLRYDAMDKFFKDLSCELMIQANNDYDKGRTKLAQAGKGVCTGLSFVRQQLETCIDISKKHFKED